MVCVKLRSLREPVLRDHKIEQYRKFVNSGVNDMKRILLASLILGAVAFNAGAEPHSFPEIELSDAALLLPAVKLFDTQKLNEGSLVAQQVLERQEHSSFLSAISPKEWVIGILGGAISCFSLSSGAQWGIPFVIGANLIYGYWYMGQKLRLDRAKLIAAAFDRELAIREREGAAK